MTSKREMLARFARYSGITRVLEALPSRPSLLILNYHRVGDPAKTPYDPGTFSCSAAELDWHVEWLKRRFPIVTLPEAVEFVHGRSWSQGTSVLLTFDDGYRDNYDEAFPVLKKHDVSATFFLPTHFVGSHSLPWWDQIAYMVKRSQEPEIRLTYPHAVTFDLVQANRREVVREVLRVYKLAAMIDTERFLRELEAATGVERPGDDAERCFLNWDEAREMQAAGMHFGSHTHTHEILGRIPYEQQLEEMVTSRRILERELHTEIDTLAYPRGRVGSFTELTFAALRAANYSTAFSFYSGVNVPGCMDPLDVMREGVNDEGRSIFRLRNAMYAATGYGLV